MTLIRVAVSPDLEISKNYESGSVGDTRGSSEKLGKNTYNSSQLVPKVLLTDVS